MANNRIIKYTDVYDQQQKKDYQYGQKGSTNLNPKREIPIRQRDLFNEIEARLQRVTDDLIRQQIDAAQGTGKGAIAGISVQEAALLASKAEAEAQAQIAGGAAANAGAGGAGGEGGGEAQAVKAPAPKPVVEVPVASTVGGGEALPVGTPLAKKLKMAAAGSSALAPITTPTAIITSQAKVLIQKVQLGPFPTTIDLLIEMALPGDNPPAIEAIRIMMVEGPDLISKATDGPPPSVIERLVELITLLPEQPSPPELEVTPTESKNAVIMPTAPNPDITLFPLLGALPGDGGFDFEPFEPILGTFPGSSVDNIKMLNSIDCDTILKSYVATLPPAEAAAVTGSTGSNSTSSNPNQGTTASNGNGTAEDLSAVIAKIDAALGDASKTLDEVIAEVKAADAQLNSMSNEAFDMVMDAVDAEFQAIQDDIQDALNDLDDMVNPEDIWGGCPQIEMGWLMIILIIAIVVGILRKIIDLVMSILMPIISAVQLAAGCWLNPTNIAKIIQLAVSLALAIACMIIALIIQLIWDLLNLDCITDQTQSLVDKIAKALSAFASVAAQFNPTNTAFLGNDVLKKVVDPIGKIGDAITENINGWKDLKQQLSAEGLAKMGGEMVGGVYKYIMNDNPNVQKAMSTYKMINPNDESGTIGSAIKKVKDAFKKKQDFGVNAQKSADSLEARLITSPQIAWANMVQTDDAETRKMK
jgi:hypothetical protein